MKTQITTTDKLENGDEILSHGNIYRLKNKHLSRCHDHNGANGPVYVFDTDHVEEVWPGCRMPEDYIVQGNKLAHWSIVTE